MENASTTARPLTLWHYSFYELLEERRPPPVEVRTEVLLSQQPSRVDLLLLRRSGEPHRDSEARVLRGLWPLLSDVTVADYKSPSREFRQAELLRLLRYGLHYHESNIAQLAGTGALTLVLLVPRMSSALRVEIELIGGTLEALGGGYARLIGPLLYSTFIVFLDEVAEAEGDEYLRIFTTHPSIRDPAARHWMEQWLIGKSNMHNAKDIEGYDEMLQKLLDSVPPEQRLAGLTPEQRLAGLKLEERLAGLKLEERLAGLKLEERLAGLTPEEEELLFRALRARHRGH